MDSVPDHDPHLGRSGRPPRPRPVGQADSNDRSRPALGSGAPGAGRRRRLGRRRAPAPPAAPTAGRATCTPSTTAPSCCGGAGDQPKIIYVRGRIDANTDDAGRRLSCADYARDGYTLQDYLATYDPAVWGRDAEPPDRSRTPARRPQQPRPRRSASRSARTPRSSGCAGASITGADLRINGEQQRDHPRPDLHRRLRLLPRLGPDRRGHRQLELRLRPDLADRGDQRLGGPQHFTDGRNLDSDPADLLRPALPGARRRAGHHQRLRPGHRLLQPVPRPRQDDADRVQRLPDHRPRQAAGDASTTTSSATSDSACRGSGSARSTSTTTTTSKPPEATTTSTCTPGGSAWSRTSSRSATA